MYLSNNLKKKQKVVIHYLNYYTEDVLKVTPYGLIKVYLQNLHGRHQMGKVEGL